jgi:hypothetical protein
MRAARQLQLLAPAFRTLIPHRPQFLGEFARGLFNKRLIARLDEVRDRFFCFQWRLALCTGDAITVDTEISSWPIVIVSVSSAIACTSFGWLSRECKTNLSVQRHGNIAPWRVCDLAMTKILVRIG